MVLPLIAAAVRAKQIKKTIDATQVALRVAGTQLKNGDKLKLNMLRFKRVDVDTSQPVKLMSKELKVPTLAQQQRDNKRRLRELASSLAAKANKRVQRLEKNGFTDRSAYIKYKDSGGKFVVKGKNDKQVLVEINRIQDFLRDETSTVSGINRQDASVAERLNLKYKTYRELREKNAAIFKILPKITEYMRMSSKVSVMYDSDQVIDEVTNYVDDILPTLADGETIDVEKALKDIEDRIVELDKKSVKTKRTNIPSFYTP